MAGRKRRCVPQYPTKREAEAGGWGLREHFPSGWRGVFGGAGGVIVIVMAGSIGMPSAHGADEGKTGFEQLEEPGGVPATQPAAARIDAAVVAPLFEHGSGRAATGCVVVSPAVFMTEEEARIIIKEELEKLGFNFTQQGIRLEGVTIAPEMGDFTRERLAKLSSDAKTVSATKTGEPLSDEARVKEMIERAVAEHERDRIVKGYRPQPVNATLADPARHIVIVFVSTRDCDRLRDPSVMSTVREYPFKDIAQRMIEKLHADGKGGSVGVFYDPTGPDPKVVEEAIAKAAGPNADERAQFRASMKVYDEMKSKAKELSGEELRKQVCDFAAWLKQRGTI